MRQFTIQRAAVLILFALVFALAVRVPVDTDTWWHIRSGEHMLQHGWIYTDPFSFTKAGEPWIDHSWGAQLVLYAAWQVGGNAGLALYVAALATLGLYFVYRMSSGTVYLRGLALVLGAAAAAVFWSARPQMFSFAFSAGLLYLLYLYQTKQADYLWWLPVVMAVWGNLHGGFSIGLIFLAGTIVGQILNQIFAPQGAMSVGWAGVRKLLLVSVVSFAAIVINPYGLQMLKVPLDTVGIGALRDYIQEWNSPDFHFRETWPFVFLLLGLLGAAGGSRKPLDWAAVLLATGTAFMALLAARNISVFAVVATPLLTHQLQAMLDERGWVLRPALRVSPRMGRLNALLTAVVVAGALLKIVAVLLPSVVAKAQEESLLPIRATRYLQTAQHPGPMFNSYNWGGYLMFALPEQPVFVDGRTDLYGNEFLSQVYVPAASAEDGWQAQLDQYGIRLVVVEVGTSLSKQLRLLPEEWTLRYEDDQAVVFTREAAQ